MDGSGNCPVLVRKIGQQDRLAVGWPFFVPEFGHDLWIERAMRWVNCKTGVLDDFQARRIVWVLRV
jgi:hypothetical protein